MDIPCIELKVLYDFEYETRDKRKISIEKGEKLFLLKKTNDDWWQVIKNSSERPFFVPASYVCVNYRSQSLPEGDCDDNFVHNVTTHQTSQLEDELFDVKSDIQYCKENILLHSQEGKIGTRHDELYLPVVQHAISNISNVKNPCMFNVSDKVRLSAYDEEFVSEICDTVSQKVSCSEDKVYLKSEPSTTSVEYSDKNVYMPKLLNQNVTSNTMDSRHKKKLFYSRSFKTKQELLKLSKCNSEITSVSSNLSNMEIKDGSSILPLDCYDIKKSINKKENNKLSNACINASTTSAAAAAAVGTTITTTNIASSMATTNINTMTTAMAATSSVTTTATTNDIPTTATNNYNNNNYNKKNSNNNKAFDACVSSVSLAFHNELYVLNHSFNDVDKQSELESVSSESLFSCEKNSENEASLQNASIRGKRSKKTVDNCLNTEDYTNKKDTSSYSSNEDMWNISSFDELPIPEGWKLSYDEEFGEQCYINEVTQAKWFSSTDEEGRVYYFNENGSESSWTLPNIVVTEGEGETRSLGSEPVEAVNPPLRNQDGEKKSRLLKARSLFLSDQKQKDISGKSSSIPRNWLQLYDLDKDVLKYGNMNRTKITENGKKISKKWAPAYVLLTDDALCFYKDLKSSSSMGLQPEMSMQLLGAKIESGEKLSSRKHVFLITSGTLQLLCECENAEVVAEWRNAISKAIESLNRHQATSVEVSSDKGKSVQSIERSRSVRVKNRDGTVEDFASNNEEQQTKIRDRLKKFFHRRPTREILASKGIYKDEPVFDSHLSKVCPLEPPFIPDFVRLCINTIEAKEENMKTDGLYRASGNLSHIQKIRLQVDQNNLSVLDTEEDVHVLTGALKLFFRELKEPLIPYELFDKAIDAGGMSGSKKEKTKIFREIVKQLPSPNYDTLKFLLEHLKRVTAFEEFNRMHIPNLAIVFGPTLMWREKEHHQNMAIEFMQQNVVIEFFLQEFSDIFR